MAKISAEEMRNEAGTEGEIVKESATESHPYAFHVSGPRNVSSPNWRDLINSSWLVSYYSYFPLSKFGHLFSFYLVHLVVYTKLIVNLSALNYGSFFIFFFFGWICRS